MKDFPDIFFKKIYSFIHSSIKIIANNLIQILNLKFSIGFRIEQNLLQFECFWMKSCHGL